ncbi:MAG TPA: FAD-dependent oxidoreductase, partial [Woeseiaceae bacterium]|nr:FAD-dependent oxidoreductase [Woeseiaceae bacterium]
MKRYDVVIAGAGIIGLSIAWQLARRSALRIAVIEKGAAVGEGSTGASSAICRVRYSNDEMLLLARDGIQAYRHWAAFTGLADPAAKFQQDGVLWMPGSDREWADLEHGRMQRFGVASEVLDDDDIAERFPALSPCTLAPDLATGEAHDCVGGSRNLFETEGGHVDPTAAARDLVEACRHAGVDVRFRRRVVGVGVSGGRVERVSLDSGDELATPLLINAAGPWCDRVSRAAGLALPWTLVPTRIQVMYRDRPEDLEGHIPVTADLAGGIYFRTQNNGRQLVIGSVREEDEREAVTDPDDFRTETDAHFEAVNLHVLHHRLPGLRSSGRVRGYCGLYTTNLEDVHPVLGPTEIEG